MRLNGYTFCLRIVSFRSLKILQQDQFAVKPDDLSLIPGTHVIERRELTPPSSPETFILQARYEFKRGLSDCVKDVYLK